ncbi:hypothetical protein CRG98_024228, partial [Punica granatum]
MLKIGGVNNDSYEHQGSATAKIGKVKKSVKKRSKSKFEEYLLKDVQLADIYAEEDLELERKLAKKLKVKEGKLRGLDDGLNEFFELPCDLELEYAEENDLKRRKKRSLGKKSKRQESNCVSNGAPDSMTRASEPQDVPDEVHSREGKKKTETLKDDSGLHLPEPTETSEEEEVPAKPPAPEAKMKYIAPHLRTRVGSEPEEHSQLRRRVRGLLNRLSEANIESITGETATIYLSLPRNVGSQILSEEVLASCAGGPRGNEQYAAVFAAFVAGMACLDEYLKEDNLSLRNLTLLLSHLCIFGVCSSDLIYDFLITLSRRMTEIDVATILTILQSCGMKIRSDDPTAMKNFIMSMEFMLETICDIKNNKKRTKEDSAPHTRIKKWLQKDRDIIRVLVECCLREKVFNKYYTVLASKLCEHDKNHKFTLQ